MCTVTIVTTAGRPDELSLQLANKACEELSLQYIPRKKRSVAKISELLNANVIVAGKNRYEYYPKGTKHPFFFHPNSAAFRLKRVERGESDPFLDACHLISGDSFLDCTLGLGSDAILASYVIGNKGRVIGLEVDPNVEFIVRNGFKSYDTTELPLTACMKNIQVVQKEAVEFLSQQPDCSFDVIYMDPMFENVIEESTNFEPLRDSGSHLLLTEKWVEEAIRVAKKRVVLKAHYQSTYFKDFGFTRNIRLTSKFHYGIIQKNNDSSI
nr:class I SAM-dependent methyltransferase [Lysinibacillus timonensis]